jgi:flagellar hook-associated protein 3 FlgL
MLDAVRVTPLMLESQMVGQMNMNQVTLAGLEEEASSGDKVNQPSDNPVAIAQILSGNSLLARLSQYQQNATDGLAYLGVASSALNQVFSVVQQVRQIALQASAADQAGSSIPVQALAERVQELQADLVTLANTTYLGHPVFGGTTGGLDAYDSAGNYLGTNTVSTRTVGPGQQVPIGIVGSAAFGTATTGLFGAVNQIYADLSSGNVGAVSSTDLSALDVAIGQLSSQTELVGGYYQTMQLAQNQQQSAQTTLQGEVSNLTQANMGKVTTELQEAQVAYEDSLWATSQVLQSSSLVSFLG